MSGAQKEKLGRGPTTGDLKRFDRASLTLTDPSDDKQYQRWASAAQRLSDKGWKPEQVIERLWSLRPDFCTPGLSAKEAARIATADQDGKLTRSLSLSPRMLYDEIEFHVSLLQTAALTGEQVVVRGKPTMDALPSHIFPTNPTWPFYADQVDLVRTFIQQRQG